MVDSSTSFDGLQPSNDELQPEVNGKLQNKAVMLKNNHILVPLNSSSGGSQPRKNDGKDSPQRVRTADKVGDGPVKWQRRDSFSSCSSDSAVFCSSRHLQKDKVAQDVKVVARCNDVAQGKRHRNSSGSSDLSSTSDASNKEIPASGMNLINFHLRGNCSKDSFPELCENVSKTTGTATKSSVSCTKTTITKSETYVRKEMTTTTTTCGTFKGAIVDDKGSQRHNLRRQIRKKTCSCDCGASLTYILRRVEVKKTKKCSTLSQVTSCSETLQNQRPPSSDEKMLRSSPISKTPPNRKQPSTFPPQPSPPKRTLPAQKQEDEALSKPSSCGRGAEMTVTSQNELKVASDTRPAVSESKGKVGKKRRTEMDRLYDALHEIKWAKHMSPDNILSQIDVRRAASVSSFSSTNKSHDSLKPESTQKPDLLDEGSVSSWSPNRVVTRNHTQMDVVKANLSASRISQSNHHSPIKSTTTERIMASSVSMTRKRGRDIVTRSRLKAGGDILNQGEDDRLQAKSVKRTALCNGLPKDHITIEKDVQQQVLHVEAVAPEVEVNRLGKEPGECLDKFVNISSKMNDKNAEKVDSGLCEEGSVKNSSSSDGSSSNENVRSDLPPVANQEVSRVELRSCEDIASYISNISSEETIFIIGSSDLLECIGELQNIKQMLKLNQSPNCTDVSMLGPCVREEEVTTSEVTEDIIADASSSDCASLPILSVDSPSTECPSDDSPPVLVPYAVPSQLMYGKDAGTMVESLLDEVEISARSKATECSCANRKLSVEVEEQESASSEKEFDEEEEEEVEEEEEEEVEEEEDEEEEEAEVEEEEEEEDEEEEEEDDDDGEDQASEDSSSSVASYPICIRSMRDYKRIFESKQHSIKKRIFKKYFKQARKRLKPLQRQRSALEPYHSNRLVRRTDFGASDIHKNYNSFLISNPEREDGPSELTSSLERNSVQNRKSRLEMHFESANSLSFQEDVFRSSWDRYYRAFSSKEHTACHSVGTSVNTDLISRTHTSFARCQELSRDYRHYWPMAYESSLNARLAHFRPVPDVPRAIMPAQPFEFESSPSDVQMSFKFSMHYKGITVNKSDGYTQVTLKLTRGEHVYFSVDVLNELKEILRNATSDSGCQVLIVNGAGSSFCSGLDLKPLLGPKKITASREMAVAIKDFIEALSTFNKPLVSVVNGAAIGLGVTFLAYSDVIIASDSSSFHMPYNLLGYPPEGAAALMLPFVVGSTVAMDLLLRGRKISAQEALEYGLISQVMSRKHLTSELIATVRSLVENPNSVTELTKSMLRMHLFQRLSIALESETEMLPKHWLSESCQAALVTAFQSGLLV